MANKLKRDKGIAAWVDLMIDHHTYLHHKRIRDEQEEQSRNDESTGNLAGTE